MIFTTNIGVLGVLLASPANAEPVEQMSQSYDGSFSYMLENLDTPFYVPPASKSGPVGTYELHSSALDSLVPFTILVVNAFVITGDVLNTTLTSYLNDDVYSNRFLDGNLSSISIKSTILMNDIGLQIISTLANALMDSTATDFLSSLELSYLLIDSSISSNVPSATNFTKSCITPPGPYLGKIVSGSLSLFKTYATFYDRYDGFMNGITPNDDISYSYVRILHPEQYEVVVPYPSRLYTSLLDPVEFPLAGLRFAIKDIVDVAGIITGGGSREYARLYNAPKNATAPAILQLIKLGATAIGKTKSATFAWGAWPDQNDDIPYPWNPRADGYLGLSASSHGSAASIASYPELDFVIGTDTGGSVRNPADRAGVYGLRPSWGVIDVTGVITSAKTLDAVGFMSRSPLLAHKIAHVWDGPANPMLKAGKFSYPRKIIYPLEWFPVNSSLAQTLIDSWITNVTKALGMSIEYQNTSAIFQNVVGFNSTLRDWTTNVSSVNIYDNWYAPLMGKQFVADYGAAFGGRYPGLDVSVRTPLAESLKYTKDYYAANVKRSWEFTKFWNEHVVVENNKTCSDGLWIYQIADTGGGVPEYRDRGLDVSQSSSSENFHET